jgi:hypothetical protein
MFTDSPLMSVVLATPDTYATIRKTILHLAGQTIRNSLEFVIVAPWQAHLGLEVDQLM